MELAADEQADKHIHSNRATFMCFVPRRSARGAGETSTQNGSGSTQGSSRNLCHAASRPNRFRDRRATRGRRRRRRSPCRSSMTSSHPAEYGFGDWQARNAACGAEFIRFRAICGHFGTNSTARTSISQPGVTLTPSPARHTWSTPSPTASPPPAPAGAPRLAFSVEALRRPADIRESPKNRRATKDASHHRLAPP